MNHLVTGIAGFIGSHIQDELIARGESVIGIDDLSGGSWGNINPRAKFIRADCADPMMDLLFRNLPVDCLWHLAADATEGRSQFTPWSATHNNIEAYSSMLSAFLRHGDPTKKRVVLFSSMSVYGEGVPPFDESSPRAPVDVYGVNKAAMERITEIMAKVHGFKYCIIRPHNVFGERQRYWDRYRNAVGIFMNRIMKWEPIYIYGDGLQKRAFSYIDNCIRPFMECCFNPATDGQIFNIGGHRETTVLDMARMVIAAMGAPTDYPIEHLPDRPCEVKNAYSTHDKSDRMIGYADATSIEEGVKEMALWAKSLGPREWTWQDLEIESNLAPVTWRKQ